MSAQSLTKLIYNLKIVPWDSKGYPSGIPFIAMFNPESFSVKEDLVWSNECASGDVGSDSQFKMTKPRAFTLSFTLDGTGVNGIKIPVTGQVALFRATTTAVQGILHRPNFLLVQYGTFLNTCVMTSSEVSYSMFDSLGLPLRAKITANFVERTTSVFSKIFASLSSPDLTHSKVVKQGDLLPLLTEEIYKNQDYEIQVARTNKLKNFRNLTAGSTIVFPPITDE